MLFYVYLSAMYCVLSCCWPIIIVAVKGRNGGLLHCRVSLSHHHVSFSVVAALDFATVAVVAPIAAEALQLSSP